MDSDETLLRDIHAALDQAGIELFPLHCLARLCGFGQSFLDGHRGGLTNEEAAALEEAVGDYSEKMANDAAYVANALMELGIGMLDAHRFLASELEPCYLFGRQMDAEAAKLVDLLLQGCYRRAYRRRELGGQPLTEKAS